MDPEQTAGRPEHFWWLLPLLVLVSGLVLTVLVAPRSQVPVITLTEELSRVHHDQLTRALVDQFSEVLSAARELSAAEPAAFNRQAEAFLDQYPAVSGLELLATVSQSQREAVERQLSSQVGRFIRFGSWAGSSETETAGASSRYLVIREAVFQPEAGPVIPSLGLVATSVPHWRDPLRTAWQDGRPIATTVTELHSNGEELRALRVFVPLRDGETDDEEQALIALVIQPLAWLSHGLEGLHDHRWQVEVHDISQHARHPLATLPSGTPPADNRPATRSTLTVADRQWMLSTRPEAMWLDGLGQQALWPAWLTGLAVTLVAAGLTAWASWRMVSLNRLLRRRTRRTRQLGQQLDNTRVEKNILHHSLQESDRRTRDLIELGMGIFAELDEGRRIGYISPQAATLLETPSTELVGMPLDALIPESDQRELAMTFDAARRDHGIQRLDTGLTPREGERLAVALRVMALRDPLSGCTGFRVTLTPRP